MLAYYDSLSGLIPVRILGAVRDPDNGLRFRLKVTAPRGSYCRGYVIESAREWRTIPRDYVRGLRSISGARILRMRDGVAACDWAPRLAGTPLAPAA